MALIIELNREAEQIQCAAGVPVANEAVSADIILFPGVRYERWTDSVADQAEQLEREIECRSDMTRRDWLEV